MTSPLNEAYCCCQLFQLRQGIFLIAVHSFLQATFGILLVVTSHYQKKDRTLNHVVVAGSICFFPTGILIFGTTLYNSYRAARFSAFLFTLVSIFNFGLALCYIFWYTEFKVNSELDKTLFWRNDQDWVAVGQLPFTIWHALAYSNAVVLVLWWYYSFQLWKFASLLKINTGYKEREVEPIFTNVRGRPEF